MMYDKLLYEAYGHRLDEADNKLQQAERAFQSSPRIETFVDLMHARKRAGFYIGIGGDKNASADYGFYIEELKRAIIKFLDTNIRRKTWIKRGEYKLRVFDNVMSLEVMIGASQNSYFPDTIRKSIYIARYTSTLNARYTSTLRHALMTYDNNDFVASSAGVNKRLSNGDVPYRSASELYTDLVDYFNSM